MIKENQQILNGINIITDGILLVFAMPLAFLFRSLVMSGYVITYSFNFYMNIGTICAFAALLLYSVFGLYGSFRSKRLLSKLGIIFKCSIIVTAVMTISLFVFRLVDFSRGIIVLYFIFSTALVFLKHAVSKFTLSLFRKNGYNLKHVLIIGNGKSAQKYLKLIKANRAYGFIPIGYISDSPSRALKIPYLGSGINLQSVLEEYSPDEAVIALKTDDWTEIQKIISICEKTGTKLSVIPAFIQVFSKMPVIDFIGDIPLMNVRKIPLDNVLNAIVKRTVDIIGSLALIVLTSPVMLIAAIGTKLSSPGPVIFAQERLGLNKVPFKMYKFRSMRVNSHESTGWSTNNDSRKTKFGSFIRKCSIDELPQLFNVLKGDMSLVGPRPELKYFADQFKEEIPLYMVKHQVRPGITGWAQVNGYRGDTSISERINHDIYYIENWSLAFDIKILFMTVFGGMINDEQLVKSDKTKSEETVNEQQSAAVGVRSK